MDKYEYRVRVEEIENLIKEMRYAEATEIADTVDWKNIKEIVTLCEISDIYKACKRYEDSRDVLLLAYERNPSGRLILYSLCELSIKLGDIVNAIEYYKEFQQVAPKDPGRYVLKYKLFTTQGVGIDERIAVLEELQTMEIKEKWMYELAYLYHMAGYGEKCVEECNQIIVFYGDGKYVIKALELKEKHEPLTDEQLALYRRLTEPAEPRLVKDVDVSNYSTMDLQKEIANGLKEVMSGEEVPVEYEAVYEPDELEAEAPVKPQEEEPEKTGFRVIEPAVNEAPAVGEAVGAGPSEGEVPEEAPQEEAPQDEEISVQENSGENAVSDETRVLPVSSDMHEITAEVTGEEPVQATESVTEAAPIETPDIAEIAVDRPEAKTDETATRIFTMGDIIEIAKATQAAMPKPVQPAAPKEVPQSNVVYPTKQPVNLNDVKVDKSSRSVRFPNFDDLMNLEGDGQMSFLVPEQEMVDKQITGQISIEDVLREWEQVRQASEQKWEEDSRRRVKEQTTEMFRDFEVDSKTGPLEIIEESFNDTVNVELTPEELSALRRSENPEFLNIDIEDPESLPTAPEPDAEDSTRVLPAPEVIDDYLMKFAEASEERDRADALAADEDGTDDLPFEEVIFNEEDYVQEALNAVPAEEQPADETTETEAATEEAETEVTTEEFTEESDLEVTEEAKEEPAEESLQEPAEESAEAPAEEAVQEASEETEEAPAAEPEKEEASPEKAPAAATASSHKEKAVSTGELDYSGLTDEQIERYESYIQKKSGLDQLKTALEHISMAPDSGNILISGDDEDSPVELARDFIYELSARDEISAGKAAKIKASTLNAKDASTVLSSLHNCAVVIQDANELRPETMDKIYRALNEPDCRMFIAMTVNKRSKNKFIMEYGNMLSSFDVAFDIEALNNGELAEYAKKYAYSREYSIDAMGLLALHTKIEERQTNSHCVMINEVKEIVDAAIVHASRKSIGHFFGVLSGKRYDVNDMIVLKEKDFSAI